MTRSESHPLLTIPLATMLSGAQSSEITGFAVPRLGARGSAVLSAALLSEAASRDGA